MASSKGTHIVTTACSHDCGGRCVLKVHVRGGAVVHIETDGGTEPQLRACLRGRAYRQRVHAPDRLKYPMKRVGKRGEGKFERISWDEALDTVAGELRRVKDSYGPASICYLGLSGSTTPLHGQRRALYRMFNMFGGCTIWWGAASFEASSFASRFTLGSTVTANSRDDLLRSRLIILWGLNPASTVWITNTSYYLARAREAGIRIVAVDPKYTDSAAAFAGQWVPIRPGTDAAMLIAMAQVMVQEDLHDRVFLDKHTIGFNRFNDYIMGTGDGEPKDPAWAEAITGVPAATTRALARVYATTKPAALLAGWGPGRTANGEQFHRAAMTLAAMTGNVGIPGGNAAGFEGTPLGVLGARLPTGRSPLLNDPEARGIRREGLNAYSRIDRTGVRVHTSKVFEAVVQGTAGGYPSDIKLLYIAACNPLNQFPNTGKVIEGLEAAEFVVVHEQFMTGTARYADILLPVNTFMEKKDIGEPWMSGPWFVYLDKALDPLHESKSDWDICRELAPRLGIDDYEEKPEETWLEEFWQATPGVPDFETFKREGVYKIDMVEPHVAFQEQIEDPQNHPFPTPSGKIEIYSQPLADMDNPLLPPIPKYVDTWEGLGDPLRSDYPLQLISTHFKTRDHSTFVRVPWLAELEPHGVFLNSDDARARDIRHGDTIRIFNGRGSVILPARVTGRIMPGVVDIPEGAWYDPDIQGRDRGGSANVLIRDDISPGGAFASNTCLVQVEKLL